MNRIELREQTVVLHLLKFLGQNGYVIEEFEKVVFEVEVDENDILASHGVQLSDVQAHVARFGPAETTQNRSKTVVASLGPAVTLQLLKFSVYEKLLSPRYDTTLIDSKRSRYIYENKYNVFV